MMKRLPLFVSFIGVVALSASLAYWALQLFPLAKRPLAAAPAHKAAEARLDDAAALFGGQALAPEVSNYQLKGVLAARNGRGSVAILVVDDKPAQALPVGREIAPGVTLTEIHPKHVLLSDGGVIKRVGLALMPSGGDAIPAAPIVVPVQPAPRMTVAPTIVSPQR